MGSVQITPRRASVEKLENDAFDFVQVSDELVDQLRGDRIGTGEQNDPVRFQREQIPNDNKENERFVAALNEQKALTERLKADLATSNATSKSLQSKLREFEGKRFEKADSDSLSQADKYWRQKIREISDFQLKSLQESNAEYKAAVDRVESKFIRTSCLTACAGLEGEVLQCYLNNPLQTLICDKVSERYVKCVDQHRREMLRQS